MSEYGRYHPGSARHEDAPAYATAKGVSDTLMASLLLVLTLPLIVALMALVKLTSRGPSLYAQARLGRGGRRYMIYKIRTMAHECERASGPVWSPTGDPRVTPLGRWLRRTHLDELPQLWNVIRGDMALVGPRPERPEFVAQLERQIPGYLGRLRVRPGITGLAQVQLPPDEDLTGVARKVACDLVYVDSMGPWLDSRILLGTVFKVAGVPFPAIRRGLALPGLPPTHRETARPAQVAEEKAASCLHAI